MSKKRKLDFIYIILIFFLYFSRDISGVYTYYNSPNMYKIIEANIYDFGFSDEQNRPILHDEIVHIRYEVDGKENIGIIGRNFLDNINNKIRIAINIKNNEIIRPSLQIGWMELALYLVCLFVAFSTITDRRA